MAGLDPQAIRELKNHILRQSRHGMGIIISSHLLHLIEDLCSRLLVLYRGACRYQGSLTDFRDGTRTGGSIEDHFLAVTANYGFEDNGQP